MTPDQAATLLATHALTHNLSETARRLGLNKAIVHRELKRAGVVTAPEPKQLRNKRRPAIDWTSQHTEIELLAIDRVKVLLPTADLRDANRVYGTSDDKRYREEHPESVHGGQGAQVIVPVQIVITQQVEDAI